MYGVTSRRSLVWSVRITCDIVVCQVFNATTLELVLGAGAMQSSAKLKRITSKHLAMALLSVTLASHVVTSLKLTLQSLLPARQQVVLGQADRVAQDMTLHAERLVGKYVMICEDLLEDVVVLPDNHNRSNGQQHPFSSDALAPSTAAVRTPAGRRGGGKQRLDASAFVENLRVLHRILMPVLPLEILEVCADSVHRW